MRETEEVAEWISDQTAIAASEDYGRDVEHVELLIQVSKFNCYPLMQHDLPINYSRLVLLKSQRFENVLSGLASSEGRVTNCLQVGQALIAEGNPESEKISAKMEETQQLWEDLKELAHARQEVSAYLFFFFLLFFFTIFTV